jgi:ribosomal protein L44E
MSITQRQVALHKCEQIEYQNKRKPTHMQYKNKNTAQRWLPCQCMKCGEHLDLLTEVHANKCGFSSKEAIIKAGYIRFKVGG